MNPKIPLIWSNDDITVGLRPKMERQLEFLSGLGIKGSFFVTPRPDQGRKRLADDSGLVALLKEAIAGGHDVNQHSTTHVCEENGTADLRMFDLMGDAMKVKHSTQRFMLERLWQADALEAQIGWGREAWIEAFGAPSDGFRPGCGAFCTGLYTALERLGFKWASSRLVSMTGWMWADGKHNYPVQWEGPERPFRQGALVEFPILDDVCFRIPKDRIDAHVELGWKHWEHCVEQSTPFLLVSHFFSLEHEGGTGYATHERLLKRILDSGRAEPMTIAEYYRRLARGEFPYADPGKLYPGPEDVPEWHVWGRKR